MKNALLFCMVWLLLMGNDLYAAGDLIVNGKLDVGGQIRATSGNGLLVQTGPNLPNVYSNLFTVSAADDTLILQTWSSKPLSLNPYGNFVGIGTTGPWATLHAFGYNSVSPQLTIESRDEDTPLGLRDTVNLYSWWVGLRKKWMSITGLGWIKQYDTNGNTVMYLAGDNAQKTTGGSWAAISDARTKKNVTPMSGALDKLMQLRSVNYEWINPEAHGDKRSIQGGFLAQDVEKVFPNWILESEAQGGDKDLSSEGKLKALQLPFEFDALVVASIQEQQRQIESLRQENAIIKAYLCNKDPKAIFCTQ